MRQARVRRNARGAAPSGAALERKLDELRVRMDALDEQLVTLLNARAACALELGRVKEALGWEIYQPSREREVLGHVSAVNGGPLDRDAITRLFERIIDEARRLERIAKAKS